VGGTRCKDAFGAWVCACACACSLTSSHLPLHLLLPPIQGHNASGFLATASVFHTHTHEWARLAPLPRPRFACTAVVLGNQFCVVGGDSGSSLETDVLAWHCQSHVWARIAELPEPRAACAAAAVASRLFVFGGFDGTNDTDTLFILDESGAWHQGSPLPCPMAWTSAAAVPGTTQVCER
jgi:hypothetical protein